ncbi:MAG: hypothetical protein QOK30_2192 [Nocardioidaceae bacterium]|nr:hypothetical protein [Nocardioidaceae bacterium]
MHDQARPVGIPTEDLTRAVGAVALAAVAVIHLVDLPGTMSETPLIGYGYYLLVGVALLGAFLLVTVPDRWVWGLVDLTAFGAVVGYVLSRTTGLPTDSLDIGNWNCSLGIAAISTETLVVMMAMWQLQRPLRSAAEPGPRPADSTSDTLGAFDQVPRHVSDRHRGR